MTKARLWLLSRAFIGSAISVGACGRAHLSGNYGQSYTAWFGAQQVNKKSMHPEESRRIIESLDAQEAERIHDRRDHAHVFVADRLELGRVELRRRDGAHDAMPHRLELPAPAAAKASDPGPG